MRRGAVPFRPEVSQLPLPTTRRAARAYIGPGGRAAGGGCRQLMGIAPKVMFLAVEDSRSNFS